MHREADRLTATDRQTDPQREGSSFGPDEGQGLRWRLKLPASPQAFMFCLQTLLTLQHTVDILCACGPSEDMF